MTFTRRLISGSSQLTLSNGIVRLLAIATTPILTSLLSPQAYGLAALVGTVIAIVPLFASAGIDMSYARAYHSADPPSGASVEIFCWRFAILGALLSAVLGAITWWLLNRYFIDEDGRLAIIVALGIVLSVTNTLAQTRARLAGRYRTMGLSIIVSGVISVAVSIGVAAWRQDALALLVPLLLGYLIPVLLFGVPSIARLAKPSGLTRSEGAALIKIGLAGVVTSPMYWLLSSSDRWFLHHHHGAVAVGVYSIGYSVAIIGMMVNDAVISVWLPEAAQEYEQSPTRSQFTLGRLMSRLVALLALVWLAVAAAGGEIIRWLANERFHAAADYVPYIAGGVFFYGVLHLANTGLLLAKRLSWAALWWLAGGVVCGLLNLTFVPNYGGIGAAVTQTASFAFVCMGVLCTSQAKLPIHLDWPRLAIVILIVVTAGTLLAPAWHGIPHLSLLMKLPIGIAVAVIVAFVMARDWCTKGIGYLRRSPATRSIEPNQF
jgi:O-antigen/teichoic acid export membrane protein